MRVSQSMLYDSFVSYLNQTTSSLQRLYEMGASQKKVVRPSDNPAAMSRILAYRDSIGALDQYKKNINSAKGWLGLADDSLQQVQDILARISELTVQASNDSLTAKDRKTISNEIRQLFDQLLAIANTSYENKSIFAGHNVSKPAYTKGMAVFSNKRNVIRTSNGSVSVLGEEKFGDCDKLSSEEMEECLKGLEGARVVDPVVAYVKSIQGITNSIIKINFSKSDTADGKAIIGVDDNIVYSYSSLDGQISGTGTLNAGDTTLDLNGIVVDLKKGLEVVVDPSSANENRTVLYVAPTAIYNGDDNNKDGIEVKDNFNVRVTPVNGSFNGDILVKVINSSPVAIGDGNEIEYQYSTDGGVTWSGVLYAENNNPSYATLELPGGEVKLEWVGPATQDLSGLKFEINGISVEQSATDIHAVAYGDMEKDIIVRIDEDVDLTLNTPFSYSYSLDNGKTWITGNLSSTKDSNGFFHLAVSGGMLKLRAAGLNTQMPNGSLFTIKPRRADIFSEITKGHFIEINQIGKEIFGGFYNNESGIEPVFEKNEKENLFLGISRLLIALESNNSADISNCLSYLEGAREVLSQWQAKIGAKENRINTTEHILNNLKLNQQERKSYLEDVDFVELITNISKNQTIYQAILKSASMIMRVSLVNYI